MVGVLVARDKQHKQRHGKDNCAQNLSEHSGVVDPRGDLNADDVRQVGNGQQKQCQEQRESLAGGIVTDDVLQQRRSGQQQDPR